MNTQNSTSQLLLDQGLKIVTEKGLRGLTVREVATGSGVNLGSFVYHFSTRERFVAELVELWYAPMYNALKITAASGTQNTAIEKLYATLAQLVEFISQNAGFIAHLIADALAGERAAQAFLLTLPERHPKLLLDLIARAQSQGSLIQEPSVHLLMFIMTAVGLPLLLAGGPLQDSDWLPPEAERLTQLMRDPKAAHARLHWALKGISTTGNASL
jgi:AcrR family transcriptional regulator